MSRDLTLNGGALLAVGIVGLAASIPRVDGGAARAIVPWFVVVLVLGLAQVVVGGGWLRNAVRDAGPAPADLAREPESETLRRCLLPALLGAIVVVLALLWAPPFAPLIAGLAAGAGATDIRSRSWIRALERDHGVTILRETSPLPFATSRKQLWALPEISGEASPPTER